MRGRFITFEGGEGAGKSTQIKRLAERLGENGLTVVVTREPGGSPRAEKIRDVLLSGAAEKLGPFGEASLFAAARADHVDTTIAPALDDGKWVLCDRFIDSTRVYQGAAGGVEPQVVNALERVAIGNLRPDATLILDIDAELGLQRAKDRREARGENEADRFEKESLEKHRDIRQAFLKIAATEPERCIVIDAGQSADIVADAIWSSIKERFEV